MLLEYHKPNSTNRCHNIEYIIVWSHKCWENNYWKNFGERTSYNFYDLDEVIQKKFSVTQEKFVKTGTLEQRDEIRGKIIGEILQAETTSVIAITPMSFSQYFKDFLNLDNVLAIELIDSAENLFDRLVFSDENDVIYKDIKNKFNVNAMPPDKATSKLIKSKALAKVIFSCLFRAPKAYM